MQQTLKWEGGDGFLMALFYFLTAYLFQGERLQKEKEKIKKSVQIVSRYAVMLPIMN
jgi:hypothetical protein